MNPTQINPFNSGVKAAPPGSSTGPIVFFDGECALCDFSVKRLLRMDRQRRLKFAPLQGDTAAQLLPEKDRRELKSLVLHDARGTARRSTAVVRILGHVGGLWAVAGTLLWCIPSPLRDWGYGVISERRYRWFGKTEACRLPQPGEREQFLP